MDQQIFHDYVKTEDPLISAIVPSYNKAPYLNETVGSILDQDYPKIEILIVDDGSPDNTKEVVEQLIESNPNRSIKYCPKPNGGISDARNFGIAQAQGRIILALDGDDKIKPTFVSKAIGAMRELGVNLVSANVELFGKEVGTWTPNQIEEFAIRYDNSIPTLIMFDRMLWQLAGGYRTAFPFVEDWDFFINCTRYGLKAYRIPEFLFQYRASDNGLASIFTDRYRECLGLVMTSNSSLYSVDEVIWAHEYLGAQMPQNFIDRFSSQLLLHPNSWLLKFWLGLVAEFHRDVQRALTLYSEAVALSAYLEWQPLFRLGSLLLTNGIEQDAFQLLHRVRIQRPDMGRRVQEYFDKV